MKKICSVISVLLFVIIFLFSGCSSEKSGNSTEETLPSLLAITSALSYKQIDPISRTYDESSTPGYYFEYISIPEQDAGKNVQFDFILDGVNTTKDVYFIFTNTSTSSSTFYPVIKDGSESINEDLIPETEGPSKLKLAQTPNQFKRGKPEISEFNRNPYLFLNKINPVNMLLSIVPPSVPKYDAPGDSHSFKIDQRSSVPAHFYTKNTNGTKTVNIWVADNCTGLSYTRPISDLVDNFLATSGEDDIYHWVTNIFGAEWGPFSSDYAKDLIPSNNEITILLLDIDNDKATESGVLGYYWAKDNFKQSAIPYSNQRIMFYMDAYFYKSHPDEIISALAHEFQHMIHFYQKTVMQVPDFKGTETWIDEMCSMATEDLVANKLGVDGPRGVSYLDGSAGSPDNTEGRLPLFNYMNDASVTTWYSGNNVIISYAINYALGAYLSRNYGGANFFRNVVQNEYLDYRAIGYALHQYDSSYSIDNSFGTILAKWGVANLLSDNIAALDDYKYNIGTWFDSLIGSIHYKAGSINLYNYTYQYSSPQLNGPYIFTKMPTGIMHPASNEYFRAAANLNGSQTWTIKLNKNVHLTVLARDPIP